MSALDVKAISPMLKKIQEGSDKQTKTEKRKKFSRIREAINRQAKPNNKK
jgi:hypothetical protein